MHHPLPNYLYSAPSRTPIHPSPPSYLLLTPILPISPILSSSKLISLSLSPSSPSPSPSLSPFPSPPNASPDPAATAPLVDPLPPRVPRTGLPVPRPELDELEDDHADEDLPETGDSEEGERDGSCAARAAALGEDRGEDLGAVADAGAGGAGFGVEDEGEEGEGGD